MIQLPTKLINLYPVHSNQPRKDFVVLDNNDNLFFHAPLYILWLTHKLSWLI